MPPLLYPPPGSKPSSHHLGLDLSASKCAPGRRSQAHLPDKIVVGTGSTLLFRTQVTVSRVSGQTDLHVVAGGISLPVRLTNRLWIAEKVRRVLQAAPSLR